MSRPSLEGSPRAPVSWGELLDKITILEVKRARIAGGAAQANVVKELMLLVEIARPALGEPRVRRLVARLKAVNARLWDIEDGIRLKEEAAEFDEAFVRLARSVYRTNDLRAAIKRRINDLLGSELVEEKSYAGGRSVRAAGASVGLSASRIRRPDSAPSSPDREPRPASARG